MSVLTDLDALFAEARRLAAEQDPVTRAAARRQEQHYAIQAAAYAGNPEQQAQMKAARSTGDAELIAIEVGLAAQRAEAALQAFDAVLAVGMARMAKPHLAAILWSVGDGTSLGRSHRDGPRIRRLRRGRGFGPLGLCPASCGHDQAQHSVEAASGDIAVSARICVCARQS